MLETIRRNKQSVFTYVIFIGLILMFGLQFGPGSSGCTGLAGTPNAASVNGDMIRQQDYARLLNQRMESMRRNAAQSRFEFTNEMAERMGIRKQVIDQLIDKKLLAHEAKKMGLEVSDAELRTYLEDTYGLKDVTPEDYRRIVESNFQMNISRFQQELRDELRGQKLQELVTESITMSDAELKANFMRDRNRAMVEFVRFDPNTVERSLPSDAEIDALIKDEAPVIEERYTADSFKYRNPEERRISQIVRKLPANATPADEAQAKSFLKELAGQIAGGADFAALAQKHSEDTNTKDKGGDQGFVRRGQLGKALDEAVFDLDKGALTPEPVRSPMGMHLIKLTDIRPPMTKELADVRREVASVILQERAAEKLAQKAAEKLLGELKAGKALASLTQSEDEAKKDGDAKKGKTDAKPVRAESPWIVKGEDSIPRIGSSKEMHDEIFALSGDAKIVPNVHRVGRNFYVAVLKEREIPDAAAFEGQKETLREQAVWEKRSQVFQEWMTHLREQAKVELNPTLFATTPTPTDAG